MYSQQQHPGYAPIPPPPPQDGQQHMPPQQASPATNGRHMMQYPQHMPPAPQMHPGHPTQPQVPYNNRINHIGGYIGSRNGRSYQLEVAQQPIRARMCGFGDKDRRPITPPPCIKLVIRDQRTQEEIDPSEIESTFFILTVDLWSVDGQTEVNLVRHSSGAPTVSISTSTTTSYPPPPERPTNVYISHHQMPPSGMNGGYRDVYGNAIGVPPQQQQMAYPPHAQSPMSQSQYSYPPTPHTPAYSPYAGAPPQQIPPYPPMPVAVGTPAPATGMFTRNLIGSLTVNAFKLNDVDRKTGFWFILQDLSVRTEGTFRLKMNFVDVGGEGRNQLNTGRAPVLASCFSEPFQVYSAKKFPGVIESTPLSKAFASQGIKIPIRKDGPKQLTNQAEYDNDD